MKLTKSKLLGEESIFLDNITTQIYFINMKAQAVDMTNKFEPFIIECAQDGTMHLLESNKHHQNSIADIGITHKEFMVRCIDPLTLFIKAKINYHVPTWENWINEKLDIVSIKFEDDTIIKDFLSKIGFTWWTGDNINDCYYPTSEIDNLAGETAVSYYINNNCSIGRVFIKDVKKHPLKTISAQRFISVVERGRKNE